MNKQMARRVAAGLAAISLLTSVMPAAGFTALADDVKYGDVNCDGKVDIMDVISINKFLLGSGDLDDKAKKNADVDCDGDQDSVDSLNILKFVVENITELPIPGSNPQPTEPDQPAQPVTEPTQPQQPVTEPTQPTQPTASITDFGTAMDASATMVSDFRKGAGDFFASDGWTNGSCFDCWWHESNTSLDNNMLTLTIDKDKGDKGMYSGAEYRTNKYYHYGYYEVSMQPIKNDGVVSSFFIYTGPSDVINGKENPWDEIDIEILGKDTTKVQLNYYKDGKGGHEYMYDLGFDAAEGYHTYGFDWQPDHITWYVDGKEAYTMRGDMPKTPGKIMMNTWPGVSDPNSKDQVIDWLKKYDGTTPISAHYQWATYKQGANAIKPSTLEELEANGAQQPTNPQPTDPPQQPTNPQPTDPPQQSGSIKDYGTPMNANATMVSDFRKGAGDFFASDGWTNGSCFDCWWHESNTSLDNNMLTLTIDKDKGGKGMYSGAEYRTNKFYGYGYYETSMQAIKNDGVVSSFFTYTGPSDNNPWDEIDIEILGKDTTKVQLNYYKDGKGGHEYMYDLGFDASEGFHTYGFDWQPDHITWYVDGKEAYTMRGDMPNTKGKIMMNTWPGVSDPNSKDQVIDWLKKYDGKTPISAHYQWATYDEKGKNGNGQQQPTNPPPQQQPSNGIKDYGTPMNANAQMVSDFRKGAGDFFASDGWTNGSCFDCWWHESNTSLDNNMLTLTIDKDKGGKGMYSGAEYRTNKFYGYGYYETSMQAIKNDGVVSSFFTYTGPSDNNPWDEIDIEILGKDTTKVQLNYYKDGKGGHEFMYDLGFDASQGFHTYGFDWQPDHITWYVDGKEAYTMRGDMPKTPGKIMMNTWPGVSDPNSKDQVIDWLKKYDGKTPISAHYQWVTYNPTR